MADFLGGLTSSLKGLGGGGFISLAWVVAGIIIGIAILGSIIYLIYNKLKWRLVVEFKLPRAIKYLNKDESIDINNVQGIINSEIGKGYFNVKEGVCYIKRPWKFKKIPMKPFQITKYLQGSSTLTVVQIGAEEYLPVLPESFMVVTDESTKEMAAIIDIQADTGKSKSWAGQFERKCKSTFSITNFLERFQAPILVGLVIFLWGIQLLLLLNRLKT